jgi:predicted metal-dependent phosphoesterase TrpH
MIGSLKMIIIHKNNHKTESFSWLERFLMQVLVNISMKFELHCHSYHSKGQKIPCEGLASPKQIARYLNKKGFGGFAITDHDSINGWDEARKEARKLGMVYIPAVEISTLGGHLIALGINEFIRPRLGVQETVDKIHDQGGVAVAPHPFDLRAEGLGKEFVKTDVVEVFNSMIVTRLENRIVEHEAKKHRMPAVGGSDAHSLDMMGMTINHINASDLDSVLKKIRKGGVRIEGKYTPIPVIISWARERMKTSYSDVRKYIRKNYIKPKAVVSRYLLKKFVNSDSDAWNALGYFSLGVSFIYSYFRMVSR